VDQRHADLARIGLTAVGRYGFALAGGYALAAHGLIDRPSEDVDLFTNHIEPDEFTEAVESITTAYTQAGYAVEVVRRAELFARLLVGGDDPVRVELAYDWRGNRPALLEIGPVLDRDDAVAGKMLALWGRGQTRDYIDVHAALVSGAYSEAKLLELAARADNGFDYTDFARMLAAVGDRPDSSFTDYGLDQAEIEALRGLLLAWGHRLAQSRDDRR
jgi:hypothetical protein